MDEHSAELLIEQSQYYNSDQHGHTGELERLMVVRRLTAALRNKLILDVGCGSGEMSAHLSAVNRCFGLDGSVGQVKRAREQGIDAHVANLQETFPFPDAVFDLVLCGETLEHLTRTDFFLCEIARVLKMGGRLLLTTPNVAAPISYAMMLVADLPPLQASRYRSPHVRDFTARTLRMALENAGFRLMKMRGDALYLPKLGEFAPTLAHRAPRLGKTLIAEAVKLRRVNYDPSSEIDTELFRSSCS